MPPMRFFLLIASVMIAAGLTVAVAVFADLPPGPLGPGTLGLGALIAALVVGLLTRSWRQK